MCCFATLFNTNRDWKCVSLLAELRAEVDVIEQMSSTGSSSSSDSASASGSDDSSSSDDECEAARPLSHTSPNRQPVANGGADRQQGNNQLMNTLRTWSLGCTNDLWILLHKVLWVIYLLFFNRSLLFSPLQETTFSSVSRGATVMMNDPFHCSLPLPLSLSTHLLLVHSLLCCDSWPQLYISVWFILFL